MTAAAGSEPAPPRRVVTAHGAAGVGVFASDGPPPHSRAVSDGATFHEVWATGAAPAPIAARAEEPQPPGERLGPPRGGTRVRIVDMPPGVRSPMHRTETVDYGAVLQGEVTLILDEAETTLRPGDVAVQQGTDHAWENRGETLARVLFVLVDGTFDAALREQIGGAVSE